MKLGIAGAGLLGRLLALRLSRHGHIVDIFDPAPGPDARGAAGWTAAGMLSPTAELESADMSVFNYGVRSIELWADLLPTLARPVAFSRAGSLLVAHRPDTGAAQRMIRLLDDKAPAGHLPQPISVAELTELEPDVHGPSQAWLLPHEGQLHTVQAMQALQASTGDTVTWHWNTTVTRLSARTLHDGRTTREFDHVFDVRGTGARDEGVSETDTAISCRQVRGVRGEIFWVHAPGVRLNRPIRLLHPRHRVYLVPRPGDIVVIGASEIESEDRSPVSLRSTVELLAAAHSVMPALAEARLVHNETNLRPALADNLPRIEHETGLTRINGLFRHGWLIAPAIVEEALTTLNFQHPRTQST
ncbi:MAG TPA: FAD-dependent oxidoreductase [Burkholderiaceae bacterium]|nr:FAD-dependent oxidoreductase [Burkholderiaceae bacterium]